MTKAGGLVSSLCWRTTCKGNQKQQPKRVICDNTDTDNNGTFEKFQEPKAPGTFGFTTKYFF